MVKNHRQETCGLPFSRVLLYAQSQTTDPLRFDPMTQVPQANALQTEQNHSPKEGESFYYLIPHSKQILFTVILILDTGLTDILVKKHFTALLFFVI